MSTLDGTDANASSLETNESQKHAKPLRWWPAAVLLATMLVIRYLPSLQESPSLPLFMLAFMGPAALAIVILLWWCVASRATWKEKVAGALGIVAIAAATVFSCHKSMLDMNLMFYVIPVGMGAFAFALILLANNAKLRVPVALLAAIIGFGSWTLLRSEGVTGRFDPTFAWRWSPSSEDKFKAELEKHSLASSDDNATKLKPVRFEAAPWPAFRGKNRDGKYYGVSIDEDWKNHPPELVWKTSIGPGWSSFSVADGLLFTQEQRDAKEAVICMSADTGERIWIYEYPSRFEESVAGAGPRATPTIAEDGLYALGANGVLVCLEAHTGKLIWKRDLQEDAKRTPPMWGFASSPLVIQGNVIVHAGGQGDKGILAYDAKTGDLKWSIASGDHSYSSAQAANFSGVSGVLMETNFGMQFFDPKDGTLHWQFESLSPNYRTLQPLVIGDSVLLASSLGGGTKRLSVKHEENDWKVEEEWASQSMKPDFNDFVEYQGNLYGFDGNIFACVSLADGKRKWKKGRYGNGQVLLLCDAGQMLVTSETGALVLLKADDKKMVELANFPAIEGKTWNHSVLIGDRVYMRNGAEAACYKLPIQRQL